MNIAQAKGKMAVISIGQDHANYESGLTGSRVMIRSFEHVTAHTVTERGRGKGDRVSSIAELTGCRKPTCSTFWSNFRFGCLLLHAPMHESMFGIVCRLMGNAGGQWRDGQGASRRGTLAEIHCSTRALPNHALFELYR